MCTMILFENYKPYFLLYSFLNRNILQEKFKKIEKIIRKKGNGLNCFSPIKYFKIYTSAQIHNLQR